MLFRHNEFQRRNFAICDTFLAVGEVLNFTKTAARLRVAQPALSRQPDQFYIGWTTRLRERLASHNRGNSAHTSKISPLEDRILCRFQFKGESNPI
jgi:hypothetical protein